MYYITFQDNKKLNVLKTLSECIRTLLIFFLLSELHPIIKAMTTEKGYFISIMQIMGVVRKLGHFFIFNFLAGELLSCSNMTLNEGELLQNVLFP